MTEAHRHHRIPFTAGSGVATGFHVLAAVGGGPVHRFEVDTGSVGVLVPRAALGPAYQQFDPSLDTTFGYVSSGRTFRGQWVKVPVVLGVPADWDGTGSFPTATVEVFAVDDPAGEDFGMLGIGFAIGGAADGGPARNPLRALTFGGLLLAPGYVVGVDGIAVGARVPADGFARVPLARAPDGRDWAQPTCELGLSDGLNIDLPILVDTGVREMILWLPAKNRPGGLAGLTALPDGVAVDLVVPGADDGPALRYGFTTGDADDPQAPPAVTLRQGRGVNTGRSLLAGSDYLFDAAAGAIGFRPRRSAWELP